MAGSQSMAAMVHASLYQFSTARRQAQPSLTLRSLTDYVPIGKTRAMSCQARSTLIACITLRVLGLEVPLRSCRLTMTMLPCLRLHQDCRPMGDLTNRLRTRVLAMPFYTGPRRQQLRHSQKLTLPLMVQARRIPM